MPPQTPRPAPSETRHSATLRISLPIGILCLIVGAIAGYGAGRISAGSPITPSNDAYQRGFDAARKKVEEAKVFPPAVSESRTLTGKVSSINGNALEIEVNLQTQNPFETLKGPVKRTVTITDKTSLFRIVPKTLEDLRAERQAAFEAASEDPAKLRPVEPFTKTPITLSDIAVGGTVIVSSEKNILNETSFEAASIELAP